MRVGQLTLGVCAISVAALHSLFEKPLAAIVPDYLPGHRELVLISGVVAAACGVGLLVPATQRLAAWLLVAWLIAVYPANLWMVRYPERYEMIPASVLWVRLPFQVPMIWWAWQYTRPVPTLLVQAVTDGGRFQRYRP